MGLRLWIADFRFSPTEYYCPKCKKYRGGFMYNPWKWFYGVYDYGNYIKIFGIKIMKRYDNKNKR